MISLSLLSLAALWIVVLRRYPAYFVPRNWKAIRARLNQRIDQGENWIEVMPSHRHFEAPVMQEVG